MQTTVVANRSDTTWMNRSQCNGSRCPSAHRHDSVMRSPPSTGLTSEARGEAYSSRQPTVTASDKEDPLKLNTTIPLPTLNHRTPPSENLSPNTIRRRASQGSLLSKPSAVSRFLSNRNVRLQIPDFDRLRTTSESPQFESRPHLPNLSTHSGLSSPQASRATRPACDSLKHPSQGDCYSTLPPTPPDDDEHVAWNPRSGMLFLEVSMNRMPGPMDEGLNRESTSKGVPDNRGSPDALSSPSSFGGSQGSPGGAMDCDQNLWLKNGIEAAVSSLSISNDRGEAVKIVSQTLPYPHTESKSVALPVQNVFSLVVQAVQNRLQQGQSPYIHITHAVPEQFSLSNLPSSPPSTPRMNFPGDDYFTSTVFSSAAVVSAYHDFRGLIQKQSSHSPMPVVPPHTVHISVLERYLPPSSSQEYKDLFLPNRPSFLVDRLFELSPNGGSLLFVYPTKRGACTFKSHYLGPILDPLLRQMVVVNELSADVGRYLGRLSSVSQMDDFDTMKMKIAQLCRDLSSPTSQFSLVDAGTDKVHFERSMWSESFIHQERSRMKDVLSLYWQNGQRLPAKSISGPPSHIIADKEVTSAMLLGEILDGIRKRPYDSEPLDRVELGVFVIRRSH